MQPENQVLSEIVHNVFPTMRQYENDVPKNFKRPCFLFINPDHNTTTQELTAFMYRVTKSFTVYAFASEQKNGNPDELLQTKNALIDYVLGVKKYPIPDTDRQFFTVELVSAETNDIRAVTTFEFQLSRIIMRNRRRPQKDKIQKVVNEFTVE